MSARVVLDTNVVVSALLKPQGSEDRVLRLALSGYFTLCTSAAVLAEYADVLPRPKLKLQAEEIERVLNELRSASKVFQPTQAVNSATDEPDNRFLECAEAAGADFLVTGNKRHFPARWKRTSIINARELLGALAHPKE
jgi:uncharacterized protein